MSTRVWTIDEMKRFAEQTKGADVTGLRFASDIIRQLITMVEKDSNNADVTISEVKKNILVAKVAKAIGAKEHSAKNAIRVVAEWINEECEYSWGEDRNSAVSQQTVMDVVKDLYAQIGDE
jgi:hypothetical protein